MELVPKVVVISIPLSDIVLTAAAVKPVPRITLALAFAVTPVAPLALLIAAAIAMALAALVEPVFSNDHLLPAQHLYQRH